MLVAAEKIGGLTLSSPQLTASREGESNGQTFVMGTASRLGEGQPFALQFSGLPSPSTWPRDVALGLAGLLALWAAWAVWNGSPEAHATRDALVAERERLLGAIAAIDAERRARGAADPRASAKRDRLVAAAEQVYAELDRLPGVSGRGAVMPAFDARCIASPRRDPRRGPTGRRCLPRILAHILGRRALPAGRLTRLGARHDDHRAA